jgi:hypothetical protein
LALALAAFPSLFLLFSFSPLHIGNMARTKSPAIRREPSDIHHQSNGVIHRDGYNSKDIPSMLVDKLAVNGTPIASGEQHVTHGAPPTEAGVLSLLFNVGGIYMSLYAHSPILHTSKQMLIDIAAALHGASSKNA